MSQRRFDRAQRLPCPAAVVFVVIVALLPLTGCGDDANDVPSAGSSSTIETGDDATSMARYAARAEGVCRRARGEIRAIGRRLEPGGSDPITLTTEGFVAPAVGVLGRFAARLRAIRPRPADPDLQAYLDYFDPILELVQQRLRTGRSRDLDQARRLEVLLFDLFEGQRALAQRLGLGGCDADFVAVLASGVRG